MINSLPPHQPEQRLELLRGEQVPIKEKEFQQFSQLIYQESGINLTRDKQSLLKTRLNKMLKQAGMSNYQAYYEYITLRQNKDKLLEVIDAISTNHTFFFREPEHFALLKKLVLPDLSQKLSAEGSKDLRLWCAASSSGEEPYCLAMTLMEFFGPQYPHWKAGVLATDISTKVLNFAQKGIYNPNQLSGLPQALQNKYFNSQADGSAEVKDFLKKEVLFRRFNLMNEQYRFRQPFHLIFCRNVLIYFDKATVEQVIHRFYHCLAPGGVLFVGHSESLKRIKNPFSLQLGPSVFQKELA